MVRKVKQTVIARPFAGGYRSDAPDYALNPNECAYSQDLIAPLGIARQRWGWAYEGDTLGSSQLTAAWRASYPIPQRKITIGSDTSGFVRVNTYTGTPILLWSNTLSAGTSWLPRCVYNGDLILCAQDGFTPLLRYAGSTQPIDTAGIWGNYTAGGTYTIPSGSSVLTGGFPVASTGIEKSGFFNAKLPGVANPTLSLHTLEYTYGSSSTSKLAVDGIRNAGGSASGTGPVSESFIGPVGFAFPAVSVYSTGTLTSCTSTSTSYSFSGTSFPAVNNTKPAQDGLLVVNKTAGSPHMMVDIVSASGTSISGGTSDKTIADTMYHIQRRLPFKDATVHKNSLWGCGVNEYPNRVYVGSPGWNLGIPPGAVEPFDPVNAHTLTDVSDFQMSTIDVPSPLDGDPVVALLSTGGPLLVLKGGAVYGIFGTYPSFEQTLIANGAGCVDLRSAVSYDGIAYWAGRDGIYSYAGSGQVTNLTSGKIQREWQALMRGYDPSITGENSFVTCGVVAGFLVVCAGDLSGLATGGAKVGPDTSNPTSRTLVYDLRTQTWSGRLSNFIPRQMQSARVAGEVPALFSVADARVGKTIDFAPALTGSLCSIRDDQKMAAASPLDAAGSGPVMTAWSSASLAQSVGIEGESRMMDLVIHTNLYDASASGAPTDVLYWTRHGDGLDEAEDSETTAYAINADTVDRVDRTKRRVNKTGRIHQVKVTQARTDSTNNKSDIPEIVVSFRDNRRMT